MALLESNRRGYHAEASYFPNRLVDTRESVGKDCKDLNGSERVAIVIDRSSQTLNNFSRYESRLERSFYRALHELQRIRALRVADLKTKPNSPAPPYPTSGIQNPASGL